MNVPDNVEGDLAGGEEPPLGKQLIEAREKIRWQLVQLRNTHSGWHGTRPPDNRNLIAELETELREINALLGNTEESDA